jgi:translation initiation factor IF-2
VKPQTIEALEHAKSAGRPIVVALTKLDKALNEADERKLIRTARSQLDNLGLTCRTDGGDTHYVKVCAPQKSGLRELLDAIVTVSSRASVQKRRLLELEQSAQSTAKTAKRGQLPVPVAEAWLLEIFTEHKKAKLTEKNIGYVGGMGRSLSVIMKRGELKIGSAISAAGEVGTIRTIMDDRGQSVQSASADFSTPLILGVKWKRGEPVKKKGDPGALLVAGFEQMGQAQRVARVTQEIRRARRIEEAEDTTAALKAEFMKNMLANKQVANLSLLRRLEREACQKSSRSNRAFNREIDFGENDSDSENSEIEASDSEDEEFLSRNTSKRKVGLILKADSDGALATLVNWVDTWNASHNNCFTVIKAAQGSIGQEDRALAGGSGSFIIGYNLIVDQEWWSPTMWPRVRTSDVIYRLFDDLEAIWEFHFRHTKYVYKKVAQLVVHSDYTVTSGPPRCVVKDGAVYGGAALDKQQYFDVVRTARDDEYGKDKQEIIYHKAKLHQLIKFHEGEPRATTTLEPGMHGSVRLRGFSTKNLRVGDRIIAKEREPRPALFGKIEQPIFWVDGFYDSAKTGKEADAEAEEEDEGRQAKARRPAPGDDKLPSYMRRLDKQWV